jgi:hypothetical protein
MRFIIRDDHEGASRWAAERIKEAILAFAPTATKPFVLGLPTGGTPVRTYQVNNYFPPDSYFCLKLVTAKHLHGEGDSFPLIPA